MSMTPASSAPLAVQRMTIEDFPDPETARVLSPNGRAHWATKRAHTRRVKLITALVAMMQNLRPMEGLVTIQPIFVYPVARKRDDDNLATGVMKAVRDGLVDAGYLVADDVDHVQQLPVQVEVQKRRRALILEFQEASSGSSGGSPARGVGDSER